MDASRNHTALTVDQALAQARQAAVARLDAQLLLAATLGRDRSWLLGHGDACLTAVEIDQWTRWLAQRASGLPLAYVLGEQLFCGLPLVVNPDVLIPRPETEDLVRWGLQLLAAMSVAAPRVLDLGTGSGAVALALKHAWPAAQVQATDRSSAALAVARANAKRLALEVEFHEADWHQANPMGSAQGQRFDLVISNPPYVAESDPHLLALTHEPRQALVAGHLGLLDLRRILALAPSLLQKQGWLLLEHGHDQAPPLQGLIRHAGFVAVETRADLAGLDRCTAGLWPGH